MSARIYRAFFWMVCLSALAFVAIGFLAEDEALASLMDGTEAYERICVAHAALTGATPQEVAEQCIHCSGYLMHTVKDVLEEAGR